MKTATPRLKHLTLIASLCLAAHCASAQELTNTWTGNGGDKKWSTANNWSGATPSSINDSLFVQGNAGTPGGGYGPLATPNNIVDGTQPINSLLFWNTNSYHVMSIGTGVTLTVGGNLAKALYVGNIFGSTYLDEGANATNYTTILGGGTLVVTSNQTLNVRMGSNSAGSHRATLDLSGLSTLNATVSQLLVGGDGSGSAGRGRPTGTLLLAQTNVIVSAGGSSGAGLDNIILGDSQGSAGNGTMYLGQTNAIFANYVLVGGRKCTAYLGFNTNASANLVNPSVVFRNSAGTGPMSYWGIGDRSSESSSSTGSGLCTADFTGAGGSVDAQVSTLYVGHGQGNTGTAGSAATGQLIFTNGTITATTFMEIGDQIALNCGAKGTVYVGGTGQLNVGTGTTSGYLRLGNTASGSSSALGSGALIIGQPFAGGSVWINGPVVEGGGGGSGQVDSITVLGGSLKVSGPVGSTASVPPSAGPLETMTVSNADLTFDLGGTPNPTTPWWQVAALNVTAPITNNVLGSALAPGQFSLLQSTQPFDGTAFVLGTLPPHVSGYLSNNIASNSVDLVITCVSTPKWNGKVGSVNNGNWDINTTANWVPISCGGEGITYLQYSVPGDSVLFDDTAAGTTTVSLTTTLSPASITVSNASENYTFTGSGAISGPAGLTKNGSGTLTLANSGTNTFSGPVAINAGTVRLSGGANLLPTNAAVTLDDDPTAALDLNNNNQMIGSLVGGGPTGGNVTLGTGTLALNEPSASNPYVYSGVISGSGGLVKSGLGTHVFDTAQLYTGGTVVSNGYLIVANPDGSGSGVGPGSVTVQPGGYFQIGDGGADGSFAVTTITNNGYVELYRNDTLTFATRLTGTGGFIIDDVNTVTITNANTYSGPTTIGSGVVYITDAGALGTGLLNIGNDDNAVLQLPGGLTLTQPISVMQKGGGNQNMAINSQGGTNVLAGQITLAGGGTYWNIESDSGSDLIVRGSSSVLSLTGGRNLILSGAGNGEWWGNLSCPTATSFGLSKRDGGTWTLWGTNIFTGTSVNGGQLTINGVLTLASASTLMVNSGAALSGSGLITSAVAINSGATLCGNAVSTSGNPTGNPAAVLTINGALSLDPSATTVLGVSHAGYDGVAGLTQANLNGTLQVVLTGALEGGETFKLFDAASYTGYFNNVILPDLGTQMLSWDTSSLASGILRVSGTLVPQIGSASIASDGNLLLSGIGPTNWTYSVLASTNVSLPLSSWVQVGSGTFAAGVFTFHDLNSTNYVRRFYSVVTQTQ